MYNPLYYDNPSVFNPDRWSTNVSHLSEPYSFIPFSAGFRSCIGKYLALKETKIILIKFLNAFDIQRTDVPLCLQAKFLYEPIEEDLIVIRKRDIPLLLFHISNKFAYIIDLNIIALSN